MEPDTYGLRRMRRAVRMNSVNKDSTDGVKRSTYKAPMLSKGNADNYDSDSINKTEVHFIEKVFLLFCILHEVSLICR